MDHVICGPTIYDESEGFCDTVGGWSGVTQVGVDFSIVNWLLGGQEFDKFGEMFGSGIGLLGMLLKGGRSWLLGEVS